MISFGIIMEGDPRTKIVDPLSPEEHIRAAIIGMNERAAESRKENVRSLAQRIDSGAFLTRQEFLAGHKINLFSGGVAASVIRRLEAALALLESTKTS